MADTPQHHDPRLAAFDPHALTIAERQYYQPGDGDVAGMFRRVAAWVASPEHDRDAWTETFYELMIGKRFCPGGRVLAGAATHHGNVLNCFVQDGRPAEPGSDAWVLSLATKLALVTKVGGGNGLCLDPILAKREFGGPRGTMYLTIGADHEDYSKVRDGTFMDLVHGSYVTRGYRSARFTEEGAAPSGLEAWRVGDSVDEIWRAAGDAALTLLEGRDVLVDLSGLRAEGTPVEGSGGTSSGPSSFAVEVFDNFATWAGLGGAEHAGPVATLRYVFAPTLRAIRQGGTRRGAGMATLSITHPDVRDFVTAKDLDRELEEGDISTFNISVLVSDAFMASARRNGPGTSTLKEIAEHAWGTGEPGLIYLDRINEYNPMRAAYGDIKSTNPCGEIPLYSGEPCDLGAMNLAQYVAEDDAGLDGFDREGFRRDVASCVRFLDNVLEVNRFALEDNREMSMKLRRLGLGVMGMADALIRMGYAYHSDQGRAAVHAMMSELRDAAVRASERLAEERGAFPAYPESDLTRERRNVAVLTVAPTGTTSMLMGVSSGVEPVFAPFIYRKIGDSYAALVHPLFEKLLDRHPPHPAFEKDGGWDWEAVVEQVQENHGSVQGLSFVPQEVQDVLICAHDIRSGDHVRMQGVVQRAFDGGENRASNSISKTINLPNAATVEDVFDAYALAFDERCKGITVYRDGSRQFQVLSTQAAKKKESSDEAPAEPADAPPVPPAVAAGEGAGEGQDAAGPTPGTAPTVPVAPPPTATPTAGARGTAAGRAGRGERLPGEPLFDRPTRLEGFTDAVKLTLSSGEKRGFYVTVNKQDGLPSEVFILSGKAGDEANADSEALGRVVSIALQYGVPAEALVKTLRGINGGMYGSYQGRMVASKADLIAIALETAGAQNLLQQGRGCPECGTPLRFEEGCMKCENCGYSKCG